MKLNPQTYQIPKDDDPMKRSCFQTNYSRDNYATFRMPIFFMGESSMPNMAGHNQADPREVKDLIHCDELLIVTKFMNYRPKKLIYSGFIIILKKNLHRISTFTS